MAFQFNEGQGSLFKNEKQNERQPDFKGSILIKGVLYNVSAWSRTSQNGKEYLSLQADERPQDGAPRQGAPRQNYGPQQPQGYQPRQPYGGYQAPQPQAAPAPSIEDLPVDIINDDLPF